MDDQERILNRYRLVERLAVGGSAEVWRAHDEQLDRPVAVKRLHPHLLPDAASRARLVAEARAAARLSHPAIAGIYDVDATGEAAAIVMELVDGESLATRIERDGALPPREAVAITADVADALFAAHQQGVVHRDVKPGNVLLAADGRTRLVDFGIAHSLAASAERLTQTGTVIGTLHAMAPEQLAGGPITPRTDLYGLGVVLLEALTARPPYPSSSPVAMAEAQRVGPPPMGDVDPALAALIAACLAYDPIDRPLHAGALAAALREYHAGNPSVAAALATAMPVDADAETRVHSMAAGVAGVDTEVARTTGVGAAPASIRVESPGRARARQWGRGFAGLLAALLAIAVIGTVLAFVAGDPTGDGGADILESPTGTPAPTATEVPEWLAERVREVAEHCGPTIAAEAEAQMSAMTEDAAKQYAEDLKKGCERDGEGGGGNGNRGRGNDD